MTRRIHRREKIYLLSTPHFFRPHKDSHWRVDDFQLTISRVNPSGERIACSEEFASKGKIMSKNMDLNTATEQELTVIQGIGKDLAKKIVQHRLQNGSFKTWEDLKRIPGLPPHMMDTLKRCGFSVGKPAA
jgi:competence ComEA-like helix-hairpin-helix protein